MTKPLKNLLPILFKEQNTWKIDLLSNWHQIMGELAQHVTLEKAKEHMLILGVFDSSWLHELHLLSPLLLERINQYLKKPLIKQLRFKQIVKKNKSQYDTPQNSWQKPTQNTMLNKKELAALEKINDNDLQEYLKKFLIRCKNY